MSLTDDLSTVCPTRDAVAQDAVDSAPARVVASPQDTAQTAELLRTCHRRGLCVVATGNRTKLAWGRPPRRLDVLLETTHMNQLVEHAQGDLIATAGAGMPLADLNARLQGAGQQLVIDDPVGGATVGGVLGAASCGARRLWAGAPRDLVLGVILVRADGTVAKAGGKVVKNVAGYDLGKLLTGSYGTLGIITQATFRLHPIPESSRWLSADVPADQLGVALAAIQSSQLVPQALEVDADADRVRLAVLFSGTSSGAQGRLDAAAELLASHGIAVEASAGALDSDADPASAKPDWVDAIPGPPGAGPLVKLTAKLSRVADVVSACRQHGVHVRGSAGVGVLFGRIEGHDAAHVAATVRGLRSVCISSGGSLVVLDATPPVKAEVDVWGDENTPGLDLMRRVKQEFDPTGTLAPGRFVGGI